MSKQTFRYLFIFDSSETETVKLNQQIRQYQTIMQRMKQLKTIEPEWHIIYVTPSIPSYALYSSAMVQIAQDEIERGVTILRNLGRILNIPESQQYLTRGNPNLQARKLAKELGIHKVIGYSKGYKTLQRKLLRMKRKLIHLENNFLEAFGFSGLNHAPYDDHKAIKKNSRLAHSTKM